MKTGAVLRAFDLPKTLQLARPQQRLSVFFPQLGIRAPFTPPDKTQRPIGFLGLGRFGGCHRSFYRSF